MPATRKYQINAENRFCCPNCDKTYKSEFSCSNHWRKEHKTQTVTINIPDTTPLRKAKMTAPSQSVSRTEFDALNAKCDTIIEMLKNMTTPTISTETSTSKQVKKQPKAKATKPPKKTAEEIYNENMNALRSHPYFSHTTEDGRDVFRCMYGNRDSVEKLLMFYKLKRGEVEQKTKWTVLLQEGKMTDEEVNVEWKAEKAKLQQDSSNFAKFEAICNRLKKAKVDYEKEQKKQTKKVKQPKKVEVEEPQEEIVEQPIEEPIQEVGKPSDNEEFKKQSKEFVIECCRTLYDGGFAKAYHHLNDHDNWHIMKVVNVKTWKDDVKRPIIKKDKDGKEMKDEFGGYVYELTKKGDLKYETVKETFTREDIDYKVLVKPSAKDDKDRYRKVRLCDIRDHMESIYKTLFDTWTEYRLSKGDKFDEEDVFDDDPTQDTWLSISHDLVNADNLQDFFWANNSH